MVAVEALWDGDTVHDWFVVLVAVLDIRAGKQTWPSSTNAVVGPPLAWRPPRGAGPWPASSACRSTSPPDVPDDEAPRWRTVRPLPGTP
ncbi:hypothetical protein QA811_34190 [Streptomyces sp. B21-102]|uniref:hypothetical protein n=1 Tax=Streptomyces sp. B21-102 TaxID=3039416 RepID=UPI002FEE6A6B